MTVQVFGRRLPATATYVAALAAALLLLVVTVLAALWQTNQGVSSTKMSANRWRSVQVCALLMRGMQDAETGQRGYHADGR